jgi:ABC-type transport system involved in multi-copper enzyme maturation permease subunit
MNNILLKLSLRDMQKALNLRTLLIWGTLSVLAVFFFFATGGKNRLMQDNKVEFLALFLPQIIFGAWAVLSVYFDMVSADRQHNVLDCILCAGISKSQIFGSKIITLAATAIILSFAYLLPVTVAIILLSGKIAHFAVLFRYLLPLWGYIMVYAALGIAISVIARSTKTALIASLAAGLVLMPRLFLLFIDGAGAVFHWTQATKDAVSRIAPGVMMEALAHYSGTAEYLKTAAVFTLSVIVLITIAYCVFCKQDELNYGE